MSLEETAALGKCLSHIFLKHLASTVGIRNMPEEERCTTLVVQRGKVQQRLYHLHDGPEQQQRGAKMRMVSPRLENI